MASLILIDPLTQGRSTGQATALSRTVWTLGTSDITPHRWGVSTAHYRATSRLDRRLYPCSLWIFSEHSNELILSK